MNIIKESNVVYVLNEANDRIAYIEFPLVTEGIVNITHTYVSDSLRGQGVAAEMMEEVIKIIKENNYQALVSCSYAKHYISTHDTGITVIG